MNSLMLHERELFMDANDGEQCNGFRPRRWYSHGFEFSLRIPHSRSGSFYPVLLGLIRSESEERARLFNLLYTNGLTTEQIGEISEAVYGPTAGSRCRSWRPLAAMTLSSGSPAAWTNTTLWSTSTPPWRAAGRQPRGALGREPPHRGDRVLECRA